MFPIPFRSKQEIPSPFGLDPVPSFIRKQTGSFGEVLAKHQTEFKTKIQIWSEALTTAANLFGWHPRPWYIFLILEDSFYLKMQSNLSSILIIFNFSMITCLRNYFIQDMVKEVLCILKRTCTPLYVESTKFHSQLQPKML